MAKPEFLPGNPRSDLTGQRFGRLVVNGYAGKRGAAHHWHCICDCGGEKSPQGNALASGATQSCGCLHKERAAAGRTKHGFASRVNGKTSEYKTWGEMIRRCHTPVDPSFSRYGGRGITVCDEWRYGVGDVSAFECFILDMGKKPTPKHEIDRKDNSLGYSESNCRWVTRTKNIRNRTNTVKVQWRGAEMSLAEACEIEGMDLARVRARMLYGWDLYSALTNKVREGNYRRKKE